MSDQKLLLKLGAHIRKVRRNRGYSQDKVYLEAGFSRGTLSKIENGINNPTFLTLCKIAETIGVPVKKLLEFEI